jgi:signal transduction histidine kinase
VEELETVSYSISHELRAPLRAMRGFSGILMMEHAEKLDEEASSYLHKINEAAGRLDQLIQDVLTYGSVESGPKLQAVQPENLIEAIIRDHPMLHGKGAEIVVETPLLPVLAHEASLSQCLSNLLINAVKFVARGTQPRVRIWTERIGSQVRLWVEDNGIGIEPRHQEQIFGMFQRLHDNCTYGGTGIGLAIAHKAVERMGGMIGVESKPGKGSRFWVQLERAM